MRIGRPPATPPTDRFGNCRYHIPGSTSKPWSAFSSGSASTATETVFPERSFLNTYLDSIVSLLQGDNRVFHIHTITHTKLPTTITKMSHIMIIFKSMLAIAVIFSVVFAAPNPDSSEPSTVTAEPGSSITEDYDSVSPTTSIGDFDEDGSLADCNDSDVASADGNGLSASSGYDSGSIINVSELPSTGMLTKPAIVVFQIFDKIIEIPINVLRYINVYLNQKLMYRGQPAGEAVSSDGSAGSSGNRTAGASVVVPTQSNYDAIFNIPITAMRSVQNLFNWVVEKLCKNRGICNSGAH